jgi:alpha-beta hydrolase superfamily lysophospholipase
MRKIILLLAMMLFIFGCSCSKQPAPGELWINTDDGFKLKATMLDAEGDKAVILLHMLDHDRSDWNLLAKKLNDNGFTVLSVDLRGNGDSEGDWRKFSNSDFNNMVNDAAAAKKTLNGKGKKSISIIGASIGANIAFKYAATDEDIKSVVLLSPGINYKGIDISGEITTFDRPVFIAVSSEDTYPYNSSNIIYSRLSGQKEILVENNLGHGTDMLPKSEELQNRIVEFVYSTT